MVGSAQSARPASRATTSSAASGCPAQSTSITTASESLIDISITPVIFVDYMRKQCGCQGPPERHRSGRGVRTRATGSGVAERIKPAEALPGDGGGDRGVGALHVDAVGGVPVRRVVAVRVAVSAVAEDGHDRAAAP